MIVCVCVRSKQHAHAARNDAGRDIMGPLKWTWCWSIPVKQTTRALPCASAPDSVAVRLLCGRKVCVPSVCACSPALSGLCCRHVACHASRAQLRMLHNLAAGGNLAAWGTHMCTHRGAQRCMPCHGTRVCKSSPRGLRRRAQSGCTRKMLVRRAARALQHCLR